MAVLWTNCCPSRVMADLKSVKGLPELLNAAELAVCRMRAARGGSAPTMVTTLSEVAFGSANAWLIRMTTSGKQGRSMGPLDASVASFWRNTRALARSSSVAAASLAGTDSAPDRYGGAGTFGIGSPRSIPLQYRRALPATRQSVRRWRAQYPRASMRRYRDRPARQFGRLSFRYAAPLPA